MSHWVYYITHIYTDNHKYMLNFLYAYISIQCYIAIYIYPQKYHGIFACLCIPTGIGVMSLEISDFSISAQMRIGCH